MLGARTILERDHPALFIELCSDPSEEGSPDFQMTRYLRTLGYEPFVFADGILRRYPCGVTKHDLFFFMAEHLTLLGLA